MSTKKSEEITHLLEAWCDGDQDALAELMPMTYQQLKQVATNMMRQERHQTLGATDLVHEAYLRLSSLERIRWRDRAHFFAMGSRLMRRILVDQARRRSREKRSGEAVKISLDEIRDQGEFAGHQVLSLDQALRDLAKIDPERAKIVEMRFFGGLSHEQIAEVMGTSRNTIVRRWRGARAWLVRYLNLDEEAA